MGTIVTGQSKVNRVQPSRSVDLAADEFRRMILAGAYLPGSHLPPERELASDLGVNRLTLRAALSRLEAEGLVCPHHGRGVEVLDLRSTGTFDLVRHLIEEGSPELIGAVLELRRAVAAEAVALAMKRHTEESLAPFAQLAAEQAKETNIARFASATSRSAARSCAPPGTWRWSS